MALAPLRKCSKPGCNTLIRGSGKCKEHKSYTVGTKNRPGDPFYSSKAWIAVRNQRRQLSPCCEECEKKGITTPTYAVDHIKPRREYPELELELENTQGLCEQHHNRKTAREVAAKRGGYPPTGGAVKFEERSVTLAVCLSAHIFWQVFNWRC